MTVLRVSGVGVSAVQYWTHARRVRKRTTRVSWVNGVVTGIGREGIGCHRGRGLIYCRAHVSVHMCHPWGVPVEPSVNVSERQ